MLVALGTILWVHVRERRYGKPPPPPIWKPSPIVNTRGKGQRAEPNPVSQGKQYLLHKLKGDGHG